MNKPEQKVKGTYCQTLKPQQSHSSPSRSVVPECLKLFALVMEKGAQLLKLLPVDATGCDHCRLWRRVALSLQTHIEKKKEILYVFRPVDLLLAQEVVFSLTRDVGAPFSQPSGSVWPLMAAQMQRELESAPVGPNITVQALHTNTSSVRSCLLQHLFIDCLVTLYDWVGTADTHKHTQGEWVSLSMNKRKGFFFCYLNGGMFSCLFFYIPWELPFTHYPGSQSQLWAFFWSEETQIEEWKMENWAKRKKRRG